MPMTTTNEPSLEHQLGNVYQRAGDSRQALRHYQQSIKHEEARGNIFGAGQTRIGIALLHAGDGRTSDALQYARSRAGQLRPGRARRGRARQPDQGAYRPA